ncbi:MAG: hypothetical protein NPIRA02_10850 [Nitrospirales bacterium]|nr:MAG: hypothetical protein NPIRA02_10850 [Nitrospirales bacterium]
MPKSGTTKTIDHVKQEISTLCQQALVDIQNDVQQAEAEEWVVAATKKRKELKLFFTELLRPAKAAVKEQEAQISSVMQPLTEMENAYRQALSTYRNKKLDEQRKQQQRLIALHSKRVERSIAKGKDPALVKPPAAVQQATKTSTTASGSATYRTEYKLNILDESTIPDDYWFVTRTLDKKMVEAALRAGKTVPGAVLVETTELTVKTA